VEEPISDRISDEYRKIVEDNGDKVGMYSVACEVWKLEHKNCRGCPMEVGCAKTVSMELVSTTPLFYKPKSYDDFEIQDKLDRILKTRTLEEVQKIAI